MKKKNSLSLTMTAVIVLCAVVVLITGLIGFVLSSQSSDAMRTLINERMLDISNTTADMLDGDALAGLSREDVDTPAYRDGMRTLRTFYDNIELEYIYCVYDRGNGLYVFGIDQDIDVGVPVNAELVTVSEDGTRDYSAFYDFDRIREKMR